MRLRRIDLSPGEVPGVGVWEPRDEKDVPDEIGLGLLGSGQYERVEEPTDDAGDAPRSREEIDAEAAGAVIATTARAGRRRREE